MADEKSNKMSEELIEKKLMSFNSTQDSVQALSLWIMHNKAHHKKIVDTWLKVLHKCEVKHKLSLFYLCNDVVQHAKKKKALYYLENFKDNLRDAVKIVRDFDSIKPNVGRIFNIWEERKIYDTKFIKELKFVLDGESSSSRGSSASGASLSPPISYKPSEKTHEKAHEKANKKEKHVKKVVERDKPVTVSTKEDEKEKAENIESDVLSEFKTSSLIEKMTAMKKQEGEVTLKAKMLASLRIDATNIEAVKQLKDRSHGNEFCRQFEESCIKIEDYVAMLEKEIKQRRVVLTLCNEAEVFYDEQFKEAKIVAIAYKNFGARITNMKKRVDDMKKIIPATPSPVPSPSADAPSPGNSPAMLDMDDNETVDMDLCNEDPDVSKTQDAFSKNVNTANKNVAVNMIQGSNLLESRIASMLPNLAKGSSSIVSPTPQLISVTVSVPSAVVLQEPPPGPVLSTPELDVKEPAQSDSSQEMYDPTMPEAILMDDNGSSTPVQDEQDNLEEKDNSPSPSPLQQVSPPRKMSPSQNVSPPAQKPTETKVKTNPIDFLSQLLTKTSSSSSSSNFLQTLSLLTNTVKSQYQKKVETEQSPTKKEDALRPSAGLLSLPTEGTFLGVQPPQQIPQTASWSSWKTGSDLSQPPLQQQHPDPSPATVSFPLRPPLPSQHPPLPEPMHPLPPPSPPSFSLPPPIGPPPISQSFVNPPPIPPPPIAKPFSLMTNSAIFLKISNSLTLSSQSAAATSVSAVTMGPQHPSFPLGLISPPVPKSMLVPTPPMPLIQSTSPTSPVYFPGNISNWSAIKSENPPLPQGQAPVVHAGFPPAPPPPPPDSVSPPVWQQNPSVNPIGHDNDSYRDNQITSLSTHRTDWKPVDPIYENNTWNREDNSGSQSLGYAHPWDQPQNYEDDEGENDYKEEQPIVHPLPPPPKKSILRNSRTSSLREVTLVDESDSSNQSSTPLSENVSSDHKPMGILKKPPLELTQVNTAIDVQSEFIAKLKQKSSPGAAILAPPPGGHALTNVPTVDTRVSEPEHLSHTSFVERSERISTIGVLGNNTRPTIKSEDTEIGEEEMEYSRNYNVPVGDTWKDKRELETKRRKYDNEDHHEHEYDMGGPSQRPRWPRLEPPRQWHPPHHRLEVYRPRAFEPRPYFQERFRGPSPGKQPFFSPRPRMPFYRY